MTANLYDTIRRIVEEQLARVRTAELAIVRDQHPHSSDSDHDNYACTVELRNSGLVLKQVPVATDRLGSVAIPGVGELVLVQFVGGDVHAPIIVGRLYNDEDRPPLNADGKAVLHVPLAAASDEAVHVELTSSGPRALSIQLGRGLRVTLSDDDPAVEVNVDGGKAALTIAKNGDVKLATSGKLALEGAEVNIKASGNLKLEGAKVDLN